MKCPHKQITNHTCQKCRVPTFTKCNHYLGGDNLGFCKIKDCGEEIGKATSNTLKTSLEYEG